MAGLVALRQVVECSDVVEVAPVLDGTLIMALVVASYLAQRCYLLASALVEARPWYEVVVAGRMMSRTREVG